ncbi:hypothetical protein FRC09_005596 [Ceratobasidium sp. 395]|nr:hypothetical protein FRC09_005596 [Ceratobasidium sp. 395]
MIRQPNQTDIVASNDANPVIADQEPKPAIHGVDSMSGFYNVSASSKLTSPEANALEYWCNTHRPTNRSAVLVVEYQNRQLASEILSHLVNHGCEDVTSKLDLNQCGTHPIAGGGFGDIYKGVLVGGAVIAIKCPRVFLKNDQESNEMLKVCLSSSSDALVAHTQNA